MWRESNEGEILLKQLLVLTIELLTLNHCLDVNASKERQCSNVFFECWFSKNRLITWFDRRDTVLSCCQLLILFKYRCMRIRPAIASTLYVGNMQKATVIHIAALHCVFLSFLSKWDSRVFLKYHRGNL